MPNYYYKDAEGQEHGPLSIDEIKSLHLSPETPIKNEFQTEWGTIDKFEELNTESVSSISATVTSTPIATAAATATAVTATKIKAAKSTAWLSWALSIAILGGAAYYIYQDIEKNKNTPNTLSISPNSTDTSITEPVITTDNSSIDTTSNVNTNPEDTTTASVNTINPEKITTPTSIAVKDKQQALAKQKKEEEKKKQQSLANQKADDEKKAQAAAQALAAKQLQIRNNWSKYISIGALNYQPKGDDGITSFDVPVYNGTDAPLNKVTVRIDYYKKEKKDKIVGTETITLYNIPAKSGLNGKAPENKRSRKAVATITSITSRQLHFCYPQGAGNSGDPYFCN